MGACVKSKSNRDFESEIFTDVEWSYKGGQIVEYFTAANEASCAETNNNALSFARGHKHMSSFTVDELSGSACDKGLLSKAGFLGRIISPSVSPSHSTLGSMKFNSGSPTSPSYWADFGETMSYDGVNKRICNRYDIGLRILKAQIECGADPKVLKTHGDRSCLMFAVLAEDFGFVKQLVGLGVDVNKTNQYGETALTFALGLEREDIASYLRINGAVENA